jgi:hypothetical protein
MATMAKRVGIIAAVASIVAACGFQAKADPLVVPQPPVTTVVDPPPYTGVDSSTPVDAVGSASDVNTVTPHVIAGLTGANLLDNSLVVTGAFSEGDPHLHRTFWVDFAGSVVQQLRAGGVATTAVLTRDTLTSAGVNVAATNITPSAGDQYISITVAFAIGNGGTERRFAYALIAKVRLRFNKWASNNSHVQCFPT